MERFFPYKREYIVVQNRNCRLWNLGSVEISKSIVRIRIDNRVHIDAANVLETTDMAGILAQKLARS